MNTLHIYPTSRVLRAISSQNREHDTLLPTLMRMDEFEQRAMLMPNKIQIDSVHRILLLREATKFEAFNTLNVNRDLVRFFTKSDAIFKFFEELSAENVNFEILLEADAYVEFEDHLDILEQLLNNYKKLLDDRGFTDKAFIHNSYVLNSGFLSAYDTIEIHIEGYLSHFELELLEKISKTTELIIYYTTSKFNVKMQERFESIGIVLPNNKHVSFSMTDKKILSIENNNSIVDAKVFSTEEKEEQVALAFVEIEKMVENGIEPEKIVLILPDENFKEHFSLFDRHSNLNFAMGYDYSKGYIYKSLEVLYAHWLNFDSNSKSLLERHGFNLEEVEKIVPSKRTNIEIFFSFIDSLGLLNCPLHNTDTKEKYNERVAEKYLHFLKIFKTEELSYKEWLFLWLKTISKITIDDVRGGLITVMGVLETRGVSFDGVVIVDFNEGIVPATSSKDQFLNSSVRTFANLPTKKDREALQKQYYKRLLEEAKESVIIYCVGDNKLPSKFLYELGLENAIQRQGQLNLLYEQPSQLIFQKDPVVNNFTAYDIEWSASRLKIYLDCKRKYYYKYIEKIKAKNDDEINEGQFLHKVLENLFNEKSSYTSQDDMYKTLNILIDSLHPKKDVKAEYQKLLWNEKLKGFVSSQIEHFNRGWKVTQREKEFYTDIGGLNFKGRIDRIDQNNTDTLVIDYKSGSIAEANKTKNLENLSDFQMSIYYHLLRSKYQNINFSFMKILEKGEIVEITALEEKNELLAEHIIELKQTTSFEAKKTEDLKKCKWCEFALMCERGEYM